MKFGINKIESNKRSGKHQFQSQTVIDRHSKLLKEKHENNNSFILEIDPNIPII
jgi:hypothetical protein